MRTLKRRLKRVERGKLKASRCDPREAPCASSSATRVRLLRLGKRAELLALGDALMLGRGDGVAGAAKLVAGLAHLQAQRLGRVGSGMRLGACRSQIGVGGVKTSLGGLCLGLQGFEPAPLDEAGSSGRSGAGRDGVAVPAPEIAFASRRAAVRA